MARAADLLLVLSHADSTVKVRPMQRHPVRLRLLDSSWSFRPDLHTNPDLPTLSRLLSMFT